MLFPLVKKSKVKYHTVLMALSIESEFDSQVYGRKYYLVTYEDNSELIFLTTNEPDYSYNEQPLDEEFSLVMNFKEMLEGFEKSEFISLEVDAVFYLLPKYIYYDIIIIDDSLKPLMLEHLKESISGYTDVDFSKNEQQKLKIWLEYLSN